MHQLAAKAVGAVVLSLKLDESDANLEGRYGRSANGSLPGKVTRPVLDPEVGGIRFDLPAGAKGQDPAGAYFASFGRQFGENQKFRVQWQQRFNRAFMETFFTLPNGHAQGGIKQVIVGLGDLPGRPAGSCTANHIVVVSYYQWRFSNMYHSCGRYLGLHTDPRFTHQNQVGTNPYCNYDMLKSESNLGKRVKPPSPCVPWLVDTWMDFAVEVENGPYNGAGRYEWSTVKLFVGTEGTPNLVHVWDSRPGRGADRAFKELGLFTGDYAKGERYGKVWLLPYMTHYVGPVPELAQTWYRNLKVIDLTENREGAGSGASSAARAGPKVPK